MLEKALVGGKWYWVWIGFLLAIIAVGAVCYLLDLEVGLSNDVPWGLFIGQYAFFVGVAASAVMVVLPYYLHNVKAFSRMTILAEFLAVVAIVMTGLFILADMGQPKRFFNLFLHPSPSSVLFWTSSALVLYLLFNLLIGWATLGAEGKGVPPPAWVKPLIYISIPWAFSIHTTTAFVFAGLPGRPFWLTALMAPRFLASAFASGPALLILLCLFVRRTHGFDVGTKAIQILANIITYALIASIFFVLMEIFTVFYSQIPEPMQPFQYLFVGLQGNYALVPWMWAAVILAVAALSLFLNPRTRQNETLLGFASAAAFTSLWIEKGLGLVVTGFIPSPLERITEYFPTGPEVAIAVGVWALGLLLLTVLYKVAIDVKEGM